MSFSGVTCCAGASSHVLLPSIRSRFTTTSSLFLTAESSSYFCARCADVAVHYSSVSSKRTDPSHIVTDVVSEQTGRKALRDVVVDFHCLIEVFNTVHIQDRSEYFSLHNRSIRGNFNDRRGDVVSRAFKYLGSVENLSSLCFRCLNTFEVGLNLNFGV